MTSKNRLHSSPASECPLREQSRLKVKDRTIPIALNDGVVGTGQGQDPGTVSRFCPRITGSEPQRRAGNLSTFHT